MHTVAMRANGSDAADGDIDPSKMPVNVNVSGGREGTTVSLGWSA